MICFIIHSKQKCDTCKHTYYYTYRAPGRRYFHWRPYQMLDTHQKKKNTRKKSIQISVAAELEKGVKTKKNGRKAYIGVRGGGGGGGGLQQKKTCHIRAKPLDFRASNGKHIRATDLRLWRKGYPNRYAIKRGKGICPPPPPPTQYYLGYVYACSLPLKAPAISGQANNHRAGLCRREKYPITGDLGNTHAVPPTPEWGGGGGICDPASQNRQKSRQTGIF